MTVNNVKPMTAAEMVEFLDDFKGVAQYLPETVAALDLAAQREREGAELRRVLADLVEEVGHAIDWRDSANWATVSGHGNPSLCRRCDGSNRGNKSCAYHQALDLLQRLGGA